MSNMSYCRFQNTAMDLDDCREGLFGRLSDEEKRARRRVVKLCVDILESLDFEVSTADGSGVDRQEIEQKFAELDNKEEDNE